jgi:hypothetical protein
MIWEAGDDVLTAVEVLRPELGDLWKAGKRQEFEERFEGLKCGGFPVGIFRWFLRNASRRAAKQGEHELDTKRFLADARLTWYQRALESRVAAGETKAIEVASGIEGMKIRLWGLERREANEHLIEAVAKAMALPLSGSEGARLSASLETRRLALEAAEGKVIDVEVVSEETEGVQNEARQ